MTIDLLEVEKAMNLIKEEIIKDLSEAVTKQSKESSLVNKSSSNLSFYDAD